ncbi:MAG: RidA family protein [Bacteroidota bacterium]
MTRLSSSLGLFLFCLSILACRPQASISPTTASSAETVQRFDRPDASILKGVAIPAGKRLYISSGQVSPPNHMDQPPKSLARYGDTYTQSVGVLQKIKGLLAEAGLGLEDVVYMGVFIAPDPNKEQQIDFDAWFKAYGTFFNHPDQPTKVARTTLGVAALARPYLLIEVEVVAVYP